MNVDFRSMTMQDLKAYVLNNRHDHDAFRALAERVATQPKGQVYGDVDIEQFSQLLKQHYPLQGETN